MSSRFVDSSDIDLDLDRIPTSRSSRLSVDSDSGSTPNLGPLCVPVAQGRFQADHISVGSADSLPPNRRNRPNPLLSEIDRQIAEYEKGMTDQQRADFRSYVESPALLPSSTPSGFSEYIWPGISMSDISRTTGLSIGGVSRIFNGKRRARRHTLISIANLYTEGDVSKVQAVIKDRVMKRLERDKSMTFEEREKLIRWYGEK